MFTAFRFNHKTQKNFNTQLSKASDANMGLKTNKILFKLNLIVF